MISFHLTSRPLAALLLCLGGTLLFCTLARAEDPQGAPVTEDNVAQAAAMDPASAIEDEIADPGPGEADPEPFDSEAFQQALADLARYEQAISELENNSGPNPYSPELTEAYLAMGTSLRKLERYEDSVAAFDKALQAARISNGLNSLQQIPILEQMRLTYLAQANWKDLDTNFHLAHYISSKNFQTGDERRIQALEALGKWKLQAARNDLIPGFRDNAGEALELYRNELKNLEAADSYEGKEIHLATLYLGQAEAAHTMAQIIYDRPLRDYATTNQRTVQERQCFPMRLPNGRVTMVCQMVEVPDLNYYIDPSNRKYADIGSQLRNMKDSILKAYQSLQTENQPERRDLLLAEVQRLTVQYNDFVSGESR